MLRQGLDPHGKETALGSVSIVNGLLFLPFECLFPVSPTGCIPKDIVKFYSCLLHFDCFKDFFQKILETC